MLLESNIYIKAAFTGISFNKNSVGEILPESNEGDGFYVPSEFPIIKYGEQWATLTIPSAEVKNVPVFFGDTNAILLKGVGHYTGSRFCGQNGNIVLSGHNNRPFNEFESIKVGASVTMNTIYGAYEYEVYDIVFFAYNDSTYLRPNDGTERLTIYTCYPLANPRAFKTQRIALLCKKISGKDWVKQ